MKRIIAIGMVVVFMVVAGLPMVGLVANNFDPTGRSANHTLFRFAGAAEYNACDNLANALNNGNKSQQAQEAIERSMERKGC
jgi:hypothetical protein